MWRTLYLLTLLGNSPLFPSSALTLSVSLTFHLLLLFVAGGSSNDGLKHRRMNCVFSDPLDIETRYK